MEPAPRILRVTCKGKLTVMVKWTKKSGGDRVLMAKIVVVSNVIFYSRIDGSKEPLQRDCPILYL